MRVEEHRVIAEAGNVEMGCELAYSAEFDLAFLDLNLAGCSSVPIAEIIQKTPRCLGLVFVGDAVEGDAGLAGKRHQRRLLLAAWRAP